MKKLTLSFVIIIGAGLALTVASWKNPEPKKTIAEQPKSSQAIVKWAIDKAHSNVKFTVSHMVVSDVDGAFKSFDGTIESNKPDFSDARINFTVDVSSIDTDNDNRDKHLKSDDFFNAEKFPKMKFESTAFKPVGDNKYQLIGNLTIRDVTKPVTFDVSYGGTAVAGNQTKAGFKATTTINRFDYNLKWDKVTEAGSLIVSKEVRIAINAEFNQVQ
jgi:polyisoprenoid-binding protein YceI